MARPRAARLGVFAVDQDAVQVAWGRLGPGRVELAVGDDAVELHTDGGPGVRSFRGLTPDTPGAVVLAGDGVPGGRIELPFRTLAALPGPERYRFATVSDTHIGCRTYGMFHTMREKPQPDEPYTVRMARAAFAEAAAWGAERLVAKGDVTHHGEVDNWLRFRDLLDEAGLVADAVPGNHDVEARREIDPNDALEKIGLAPIPDGVRWFDVPALRIVLLDSTRLGDRRGRVDHLHEGLREAVSSTSLPVWIGLHHHLEPLRWSYFYPPGVRGRHTSRFLDEIVAGNPNAFVTSGHTHRNRKRQVGGVVLTEVGSPQDYPGTWAAYTVHDAGIRQVTWRTEDPSCTPWIEYSRRAAGTLWGRWSPGRLDQRSFNHRWR
ncbi:MAG: metallophosphoesterase family protein [Acidimicrobiales bacterium]|nr:metallophosphoesterase family protein [Acidimicrobiales bacterium]MCB9373202.1 metallophosphoesterase family protein [Microthrixaceae bacterium]